MNKLAVLILALAASGCVNWEQYSCGGQIKCTDEQMAQKTRPQTVGKDYYTSPEHLKWREEQEQRKQQLAACDQLDSKIESADKHTQDMIKTVLKHTLKDPDSARFGNIYKASLSQQCRINLTHPVAVKLLPDWKYIGLVNAKNSYGGYVGDKMFISNGSVSLLLN